MTGTGRTSPPEALTRPSRGPGWIWAVPLAALAIVAWLLVRFLAQGGTDITIVFPEAHGISANSTAVTYRGVKVGSVTRLSLTNDASAVTVTANMLNSAEKLLTAGTVFWLQGAQPSLGDLSTLGAVLSGPTIVMEAGPGKPARHFNGLAHRPLPGNRGTSVLFTASFDGAVGDLSPGAIVKVRGFPVGEVKAIGFRYDARTGKIDTPVTLALYPALFHVEGGPQPDPTTTFRAALDRLVREGLRARLERDPPLVGEYRVALEMVSGAPPATVHTANGMPEIPTAPDGGLDSIVSRFNRVPIDQIAQHVLDLTKHVDAMVSSPKLNDSVDQLDASLRQIHDVVANLGPKVDKLVRSLHETAGRLDQAARNADRTLGGPESQTGMSDTMREIKAAARSVRSLADYLERHPESILSGKPRG